MRIVRNLAWPLLAACAAALVTASLATATHLGYLQLGHTVSGDVASGVSGSIGEPLFHARNRHGGDDAVALSGLHSSTLGAGAGVRGTSNSTANVAYGVLGEIPSLAPGPSSAGVRGANAGTGNDGVGVWGTHAGSGRGVFGQAPKGTGVYGLHSATTGAAPGVRGRSSSTHADAAGVLGEISSTEPGAYAAGVRGTNAGTGGYGYGVSGEHLGAGPGVHGGGTNGFGGEFISENYRGLYARGGPSWIAAYLDGWAYVNGNLDVTADAWITGDLSVSGTCTGCTDAMAARNSGATSIAPGDLVAAAGVKVDPASSEPVLLVRRAAEGDDAVVGVAAGTLAPPSRRAAGDTAAAGLVPVKRAAGPDERVRVVTSGLAQVRAGTSVARIGDRLVAGAAGRAERRTTGASVARVMSSPDSAGLVWALVDGS